VGGSDHEGDELLKELDDGLARVKETYPTASRVIDGYRELFHAFYEVYVSTKPERDVNQDLRYIETLVRNKYVLTQVELTLELDPDIPPLRLEGGMQSIFLELMQNAARHGAVRLLVQTACDPETGDVRLQFYNDGDAIPEEDRASLLEHDVSDQGRGFGLADARYIVEALNGGRLRLSPSDREDFAVLFVIELPADAGRDTGAGTHAAT
jgi:K+-sensing histidine kinase KdpD